MSALGSGLVDPRHWVLLGAVCRLRMGEGFCAQASHHVGQGCRR